MSSHVQSRPVETSRVESSRLSCPRRPHASAGDMEARRRPRASAGDMEARRRPRPNPKSSPVQSSPAQSSPVQSSPAQPSPVKVASPQVKCGRVWSSVVECGPVSSSVGEVRRVSSIDCCPRTSSPRGAPQERKSSAEVVRRARAYLPACSKRRPLSLGPTLKLEAWKRPWKEPPSSWGSSSSRWPRCRCPWCLRRRASRRR